MKLKIDGIKKIISNLSEKYNINPNYNIEVNVVIPSIIPIKIDPFNESLKIYILEDINLFGYETILEKLYFIPSRFYKDHIIYRNLKMRKVHYITSNLNVDRIIKKYISSVMNLYKLAILSGKASYILKRMNRNINIDARLIVSLINKMVIGLKSFYINPFLFFQSSIIYILFKKYYNMNADLEKSIPSNVAKIVFYSINKILTENIDIININRINQRIFNFYSLLTSYMIV